MNADCDRHLFVIFGATGDLTTRKLLPALYRVITVTYWILRLQEVDSKLNSFLVNHQEYAPASGMKGMMPHVTFASYDSRR